MKDIIYLHGFKSSPQSLKAKQTKAYIEAHHPEIEIIMPQLPNHPEEVAALLRQLIDHYKDNLLGFIGSSLGGYFSVWCAQQTGLPAVLINPAAYPYILLEDYQGKHEHPYTKTEFEVTPCFNQHLRDFDVSNVDDLELWLLLQTEDETLNYQNAVDKYKGSKMTIEEGGNHSFENFERFLPEIIEYLSAKA